MPQVTLHPPDLGQLGRAVSNGRSQGRRIGAVDDNQLPLQFRKLLDATHSDGVLGERQREPFRQHGSHAPCSNHLGKSAEGIRLGHDPEPEFESLRQGD